MGLAQVDGIQGMKEALEKQLGSTRITIIRSHRQLGTFVAQGEESYRHAIW